MKFIILDRQEGKTAALVYWVRQGHEINSWPGWSRIIVTHSTQEANRLRNTMREELGLDYHQVFSLGEWQHRSKGAQRENVEVGVDNADIMLSGLLGLFTNLSVVTATGELYDPLCDA